MTLQNEKKLTTDQMENVTGGTRLETYADAEELYKRGLIDSPNANCATVRDTLQKLGFKYENHGGIFKGNEYFNKSGKKVSREQFWEKFDADRRW